MWQKQLWRECSIPSVGSNPFGGTVALSPILQDHETIPPSYHSSHRTSIIRSSPKHSLNALLSKSWRTRALDYSQILLQRLATIALLVENK